MTFSSGKLHDVHFSEDARRTIGHSLEHLTMILKVIKLAIKVYSSEFAEFSLACAIVLA